MLKFDVLVIGAGPAGIAAGSLLVKTNLRFLILEAGGPLETRSKKDPKSCAQGYVGCGLFSDGKFSFAPSASGLVNLLGSSGTFVDCGSWLYERLLNQGIRPTTTKMRNGKTDITQDWTAKPYNSCKTTLAERKLMLEEFLTLIGTQRVRYHHFVQNWQCNPVGIVHLQVNTPDGPLSLLSRKILVACGRFVHPHYHPKSKEDIQDIQDIQEKTIVRRIEVGIRIQGPCSHRLWDVLNKKCNSSLDPKFISKAKILPKNNDIVEYRTFCYCERGEIIPTKIDGITSFSGQTDENELTLLTNMAFNIRYLSPSVEIQRKFLRFLESLRNGQTVPFQKMLLSEFFWFPFDDIWFYIQPLRDALSDFLVMPNGIANLSRIPPNFTVHGPTIKGTGGFSSIFP